MSMYFDFKKLPALRAGKVWGFLMFPMGRTEVHQINPELATLIPSALEKLRNGQRAYVLLEDAAALVQQRMREIESA